MKTIKIGIAGFGTVGAGVVDILQRRRDEFAAAHGVKLEITTIVARDLKRDRGVVIDESLLTQDVSTLADVDIVVELIGGDSVAKAIVLDAIKSGKAVVTANKALLADHWNEVFEAVDQYHGILKFEAAVAGAIPIIKTVQESLAGNQIQSMAGIINGTANYILTEMESRKESLPVILKEAQDKGYAEADPTFDVDGIDTAHKLIILAALAYGLQISLDDLYVEGISRVTLDDILYANELGYRIKLLAIAKDHDQNVEMRVHPTLIPQTEVMAAVSGAYNAVDVRGDAAGDILLYGQGAGRYPTASAVVGDILDVALQGRHVPRNVSCDKSLLLMGDIETRYYLRLSVCDQAGVLAEITNIFGTHGIGIASVIQKELSQGEMVPLVIMTDIAREANMQTALQEIVSLQSVANDAMLIRIED